MNQEGRAKRASGGFDPKCLGYGVQWGVRLTVLFADTLFLTRGNRGTDSFNYALQLVAVVACLAMAAVLWRRREDLRSFDRMIGMLYAVQAAMLCAGVAWVALASFAASFTVMSAVAGTLMGCGFGMGSFTWLYLYARRGQHVARPAIILSWLVGVGLFAVLAVMPSVARLVACSACVVVALWMERGCMAEVMNPQGHGGELGVSSFFDPDERDAKSALTMARRAFFAVMALGFVFGASGPVLFHGAEVSSGDVQTLLGHLGALTASVLISSLVILAFPRRADFTVVFQAAFTLVATASLALPFVGTWCLGAYNVVVEVVFRVVSLLVAYLCTTVRGNRTFCRTVPFFADKRQHRPYGGGCFW